MNFSTIFSIIIIIVSVESDSKSNRINEIRKSVLNYFLANPNSAYKSDIDLVANNDWLIEKFLSSLLKNTDPDKSLIESLKAWKKDNILELNDTSFPSEFYGLGHVWDFGVAKDGTTLMGFNLVCSPPTSKVDNVIAEWALKFMRYKLRKIIYSRAAKNYYLYGNFDAPNIMDTDIATVKELINIFLVHNPQFAAFNYVYKVHGGLTAVLKALFSTAIPNYESFIKFIDTETEWQQYISLDQMPSHIFGRNKSYAFIPDGVKSVKCKHLLQFNQNPSDKQNWDFLKDIRIDCYLKTLQSTGKSSLEEFLREC